jgi:hypothetical protein
MPARTMPDAAAQVAVLLAHIIRCVVIQLDVQGVVIWYDAPWTLN